MLIIKLVGEKGSIGSIQSMGSFLSACRYAAAEWLHQPARLQRSLPIQIFQLT
jgi:hypothetical protein